MNPMYPVVKIATDDLTDLELAIVNNVAQLDYDPRGRDACDKIDELWDTVDQNGCPHMNDLTKEALSAVVLQRLT